MIKQLAKLKSPSFKWDFLVRLIHWLVAILFFLNHFITDPDSQIHEYFGYAILCLIALRIFWAFVPFSDESVKLKRLKPTLGQIKNHLSELFKREYRQTRGHNPLGSLMVIAIWTFLSLSVLTGYISTTDFGIDYDIEEIHEFFVDFSLVLVAIHIVAVFLLSFVLKTNLIQTISLIAKKKND